MAKTPNLRLATATAEPAHDGRAELRAAIAAATQVEHAVEAARSAVTRASGMVEQAQARLEAASAGAAKARDALADRVVVAAKSGAPAPDMSMGAARLREVDAQDEFEACRSALTTCEAALAGSEAELVRAQKRVSLAADDVIKAAGAARLLKEAEAVQADLVNRRVVLRHLLREGLVGEAQVAPLWEFLFRNRELPGAPPLSVAGLPGGGMSSVEHQNWDAHAAATPWRQAREALQHDADAALPD
jgi:hypothetical protein